MKDSDAFSKGNFVVGSYKSLRIFGVGYSATLGRVVMTPSFAVSRVYSSPEWYTASCGRWSYDANKARKLLGFLRDQPVGFGSFAITDGRPHIEVRYEERKPISAGEFWESQPQWPRFAVTKTITVPLVDVINLTTHTPPDRLCVCGFYSFYNRDYMVRGHNYYDDVSAIIGVVENAGRVLHGSLGLRSERMRILGWTWAPWTTFPFVSNPSETWYMPTIQHFNLTERVHFGLRSAVHSAPAVEVLTELERVAPFYATYDRLLINHPLSLPASVGLPYDS